MTICIKRNACTCTHLCVYIYILHSYRYNCVHNLLRNSGKESRNFFKVFILFLIMCMNVFLWACAYECRCLKSPEEGARSLRARVTGGCKLPGVGPGN